MFAIEDSCKEMHRGFEAWVETLDKGLKVLDVFSVFESRLGRLSARDQAILTPDKVIMFLRAVDLKPLNRILYLYISGIHSRSSTTKCI